MSAEPEAVGADLAAHLEEMRRLAERLFPVDGRITVPSDADLDPEGTAWSASTGTTSRLADNVAGLAGLLARVPDLHREDVRIHPIVDGFVVEAALVGTGPGGLTGRSALCLVAAVRDGRMVHENVYSDPASAAQIFSGS